MNCIGIIPYLKGQDKRFGPAHAIIGEMPLYAKSAECALACALCRQVIILSNDHKLLADASERYGDRVAEVAVSDRDISLLRTRGDIFEYVFQLYPDAEAAGLFLPKYPFRDAGRIIRDIAPHLHYGRLLSSQGFDVPAISTFDIWMKDEVGWTPVCSGQEQFVHPRNEVYAFAAKGYHYGDFTDMYLGRNEGVLSIYCLGVEDFSVTTAEDVMRANKALSENISPPPALRSTEINGRVIVAPGDISGENVMAAIDGAWTDNQETWLILENDCFNLRTVCFYDLIEARNFMHPVAYRLLRDPDKPCGTEGVRFGLQSSRFRVFTKEHSNTQARIFAHDRLGDDPLQIPASRVVQEKNLRLLPEPMTGLAGREGVT